jgi:hypothetical protein
MQRRAILSIGLGWAAVAGAGAATARDLSESDAAQGVRQALERGAAAAVTALGRTDGFLGNAAVRIPLPGAFEDAARLLRRTGQGDRVDELVVAMNRAAEAAVPEARTMLLSAVKGMSIEDARRIVAGPPDAATRFFADKTREPLTLRFQPIVARTTQRVRLAEQYNALAGRAAGLGLLRGERVSVEAHVTAKALDGLYFMIGEEERRLRRDPVAAGSELLRRVFGGVR